MFHHHLSVVMMFAALALLAGCQKDLVKAPPAGQDDMLHVNAYPRIVAAEGLGDWLRFSPAIITATDGQRPMHIVIPLRSVYDKYPLDVQYQFEFFDEAGRSTGASPGWIFLHLEPRLQSQIEASALDANAKDWRLTLRAAR